MHFDERTLFKRIRNSTTWRDLREIFKKVRATWKKHYVSAFLCHLDSLDLRYMTPEEKEILDEFVEEVKDQPEVED